MYRNQLCLLVCAMFVLVAGGTVVAAEKEEAVLDKDPNLMAWWKFDETEGKTVSDSSGHKHNGTLKGVILIETNSSDGRIGRAMKFGGNGGYIEIKDYKGVVGTHSRTVAAWIKTESSRGEIISWGEDDFGKMWRFQHIRGRIGVTPQGGYYYMNPATNDDKWHHVAVVLGEAELPNLHDDVTLYLDGEIAEIHDIGLLDLWPIETGKVLDVRIGMGFSGLLDDLRIYNRPLTTEEIKVLFKLESNKPTPKK